MEMLQVMWTPAAKGGIECAECHKRRESGAIVLCIRRLTDDQRVYLCEGCGKRATQRPQQALVQRPRAKRSSVVATALGAYDPDLQMFVSAPREIDWAYLEHRLGRGDWDRDKMYALLAWTEVQ